jgi:2-keto-4-pentenoate hydratase/2-oxohepta-3-ene-1,7-dioic acid hydratase in catechol pathway
MAGRLGPAKSKDFDTGNVLGPWLVTPDELENPYNLRMQARINGEQWSSGNSGEMRFTFEQMIAAISQDETLYPGDVIGSGTVPTGCGLELDRWLKPGDVVELEIERIGILRNRVRG